MVQSIFTHRGYKKSPTPVNGQCCDATLRSLKGAKIVHKKGVSQSLADMKLNLLSNKEPVIVNKPEDKFETVLFLPKNSKRKSEGGLRTKGFFKHSYKLLKTQPLEVSQFNSHTLPLLSDIWFICDTDFNPVTPAQESIQQKIKQYCNSSHSNSGSIYKPLSSTCISELPLITVITVVLNGERDLEKTIHSVINQSYPNVEFIIIDGGSIDGTLDIIKKYEDYIDYWVSERDEGISDAFNKGLKLALGDIIGIINSGDEYCENIFDKLCVEFIGNEIDFLYGNMLLLDASDQKLKYLKPHFNKNKFPYGAMPFGHPTLFAKNKLYKNVGLYNINYIIAMDFEYLTRIYKYRSYYLDECIAKYRRGGISDKMFLRAHREILAASLICKEVKFIIAIFAYLFGVCRTILRKIIEK